MTVWIWKTTEDCSNYRYLLNRNDLFSAEENIILKETVVNILYFKQVIKRGKTGTLHPVVQYFVRRKSAIHCYITALYRIYLRVYTETIVERDLMFQNQRWNFLSFYAYALNLRSFDLSPRPLGWLSLEIHVIHRVREKKSGQTHLFNIWTIKAMDRT